MSRALAAALCLAFSTSALAATTAQQQRMKDCSQKAGDLKGDERKAFMSKCLKGEDAKSAVTPQQQKMTDCNKQAGEKKLAGEERKKFMSECLKGTGT